MHENKNSYVCINCRKNFDSSNLVMLYIVNDFRETTIPYCYVLGSIFCDVQYGTIPYTPNNRSKVSKKYMCKAFVAHHRTRDPETSPKNEGCDHDHQSDVPAYALSLSSMNEIRCEEGKSVCTVL